MLEDAYPCSLTWQDGGRYTVSLAWQDADSERNGGEE